MSTDVSVDMSVRPAVCMGLNVSTSASADLSVAVNAD